MYPQSLQGEVYLKMGGEGSEIIKTVRFDCLHLITWFKNDNRAGNLRQRRHAALSQPSKRKVRMLNVVLVGRIFWKLGGF